MKFISSLLSVILLLLLCAARGDDVNPCDGEMFALVCKTLRIMKRDAALSKRRLEERFNAINELQLNDTRDTKMAIQQEANKLSQKHASDVRMVTDMMERKLKALSSLLRHKIIETKQGLEIKNDNILRSTKGDLSKLKMEVLKRLENNTAVYKRGVQKVETQIQVNKNTLTQQLQSEVGTVRTDISSKYNTLKQESGTNLAALKSEIIQHIQRNNQQLQDLKNKYDQVKTPKWPAGGYCILANGKCPSWFKLVYGYMRAISLFAGNIHYIRQATFGSSNIRCHGRCGQYGHWIGELNLNACCKEGTTF